MAIKAMIFMVLLGLMFSATASSGEKLMWKEGLASRYFDSAPASELLTPPEYNKYLKLLKELDCGPAALLLNRAFVKRYPQFSDASAPRGPEFIRWFGLYVHNEFPGLSFCKYSLQLKHHELLLAEGGRKIGKFYRGDRRKPYHYKETPYKYNKEWSDRDHYARGILLRAGQDYPPALLEIAKLVRRGDIFEIEPDFEYYLIKRACHLGHPCDEYQERLKELRAMIPVEKTKLMALTAKRKNIALEKLDIFNAP